MTSIKVSFSTYIERTKLSTKKTVLHIAVGSYLQVWLAYYLLDKENAGICLPVEHLERLTGLDRHDIIEARWWLEAKGLLNDTGEIVVEDGVQEVYTTETIRVRVSGLEAKVHKAA